MERKKKYQTPQMEVLKFEQRCQMLYESGDGGGMPPGVPGEPF